MDLKEHEPVGAKTTMRIGGAARFYGEAATRDDVEFACTFATERGVPLVVLGGGSNTVFADGEVNALVLRIKADAMGRDGNRLTVQCGKILATLLNDCAEQGLDLSPLTGIPGTVGGAIVGNAGQGHGGIWIDRYVKDVTFFTNGEWRTLRRDACGFQYRESGFKHMPGPVVLWEATLEAPAGDPAAIRAEIERLLQRRIETQPHRKTAGSCFASLPDGTPAWKLIDTAGLRGRRIGDIEIAQKHANFLLNIGTATYADAKEAVRTIRDAVDAPLSVEMRFIEPDGSVAF